MARKPDDDGKDGKGLSLADIIRLGKTRELNFVAAIGKDGAALVGDLRKSGNALWNLAKERHDGISRAKAVMGRLTINGKELNLSLDDEEIPGALKKQLKKTLKEAGSPMKIVFRLPGGKTEEEAGEDEPEEGTEPAATRPAVGTADPGAEDPAADLRERLLAEAEAMRADFERVIAEGAPGAGKKAEQLDRMFREAVAGADPSRAMPVLRLLTTFVAGEVMRLNRAKAGGTAPMAQPGKLAGGAEDNPFAGTAKGGAGFGGIGGAMSKALGGDLGKVAGAAIGGFVADGGIGKAAGGILGDLGKIIGGAAAPSAPGEGEGKSVVGPAGGASGQAEGDGGKGMESFGGIGGAMAKAFGGDLGKAVADAIGGLATGGLEKMAGGAFGDLGKAAGMAAGGSSGGPAGKSPVGSEGAKGPEGAEGKGGAAPGGTAGAKGF